jgi:hypothetical protein
MCICSDVENPRAKSPEDEVCSVKMHPIVEFSTNSPVDAPDTEEEHPTDPGTSDTLTNR